MPKSKNVMPEMTTVTQTLYHLMKSDVDKMLVENIFMILPGNVSTSLSLHSVLAFLCSSKWNLLACRRQLYGLKRKILFDHLVESLNTSRVNHTSACRCLKNRKLINANSKGN